MNQIDLEGRVVVITGGARGIGYAVAQRALRSGAAVSLWDIDGELEGDCDMRSESAVSSSDLGRLRVDMVGDEYAAKGRVS